MRAARWGDIPGYQQEDGHAHAVQEAGGQRRSLSARGTSLRRRQGQRGTARYATSFPRDVRRRERPGPNTRRRSKPPTRHDGGEIMQVKTKLKSGCLSLNHNQTLVRDGAPATAGTHPHAARQGIKVKTKVKAGAYSWNHNQTLVRDSIKRR
jgi:hypothetical protein